jgi:hypothetical protein
MSWNHLDVSACIMSSALGCFTYYKALPALLQHHETPKPGAQTVCIHELMSADACIAFICACSNSPQESVHAGTAISNSILVGMLTVIAARRCMHVWECVCMHKAYAHGDYCKSMHACAFK